MQKQNISRAARTLLEWFSGRVPDTMDELLMLPGVGRKTANIVLDHAFSKNVGIAVDTHVRRLAQRIGFSDSSNPDRIEEDLMAMFPQEIWGELTYCLIRHGEGGLFGTKTCLSLLCHCITLPVWAVRIIVITEQRSSRRRVQLLVP